MKQPVFHHRLIVCLPAHTPEHDDDVGYPPETAEAKQHTCLPERLPGRAEYRGDQQREAKMHDVGLVECLIPTTRRRPPYSPPRDPPDDSDPLPPHFPPTRPQST